jgi:hypothetical protein
MRYVILAMLVVVGCVGTGIPDDPTITADLAVETALLVAELRAGPPPAPAPRGECENCNGTGKIRSGDGIEVFTCPVCGGTGKPVVSVLHPAVFVPLVAEGSR